MNEEKLEDYEDKFFKQFGYDKPCKCVICFLNNLFVTNMYNCRHFVNNYYSIN